MTGNSGSGSECLLKNAPTILGCKIDEKLKGTQIMLATLNSIDTSDDDYLEEKVTQAKWFAGIGTAGPAVVAGTMLIIFRIAMALFVGFAPIFILCLLFKKTAPLFQKWLFYGLATIFSGVMLGVMAEIAMDLVGTITSAATATNYVSTLFTGRSAEGIMQTVTQQLGLGVILSALLITVPPMAGMWFNGVMASSYYGSNYISGWNGMSGSVAGSGSGSGAYQQQVEQKVQHQYEKTLDSNQRSTVDSNAFNYNSGRVSASSNLRQLQSTDEIKSNNAQFQNGLTGRVPSQSQLPTSKLDKKESES